MIRFAALGLTVLTGACGLVYEVVWQKYLATLLGSHSEATAAVLAIFLGGLSAGYALFGALTRRLVANAQRTGRPARLLLVYGGVELAIGVYVALFPLGFELAQRASLRVPAGHPALGFGFDVALSALLIGPPSVLMGATIPILTLALAGELAQATRVHAWVYGFNTLGACAGALAGAFLLVPALGLDGTLRAMAAVNLLAGASFAALDSRARGRAVAPAPAGGATHPQFASYALVAALAGFGMMTLQTTLNRVGALALGSSPFTFAMIVAAFVLCIAIGSLGVSALPRVPKGLLDGSQWALVLLLALLYLQVEDIPYWAHRLRTAFTQIDGAFYPFQSLVFAWLLLLLLLPVGLSGALLPLIFDRLRRDLGELGSLAGRLYAWNTVGSLLGALFGGYLLLLWLDLHQVFRIALAALVLGAALLSSLVWQRSRVALAAGVVLPMAVALFALPPWQPQRLTAGLFRQRAALESTALGPDEAARRFQGDIVFYDDDPDSTVSVLRTGSDGRRSHSLVVNGKSDGNVVTDYLTMGMMALLPALMADSHERCFVVGFGTGVSAGELAALHATREVDVAEISRAVIAAAPIFDYANQGVSGSPKLTIQRGDAYRALLTSEGRYDVIVSEPSNPWVTGVEMLFSQEFLEAARSRLRPGGVYAQWFHLYETDERSVELVLRTYASVFPHVSVWFAQGTDLLLLGFDRESRALDPAALKARFEQPDFRAGFERVGIGRFEGLLAHELLPLGTLHAQAGPGEIHTLRHPLLGYRAARAFFRGRTAQLPRPLDPESTAIGARNSLLGRYAGAGTTPLPEALFEAALQQACGESRVRECTTFLARWYDDHPRSERREQLTAYWRSRLGRSAPSPPLVAQLATLFGESPPPADSTQEITVREAIQTTREYVTFYHHAFPFDPAVIRRVWSQCAGEKCEASRRRAEQQLGFELPASRVADAPAPRD